MDYEKKKSIDFAPNTQHHTHTMNDLLNSALNIATEMHRGQFRRDGVTPYINHPMDVARRVKQRGGDERAQAVAALHDILEDTEFTLHDLIQAGFDTDIINAVLALSKLNDIDYKEYLNLVKQNDLSRVVKIADMLSNLADNPTNRQIKKYAKGLAFLME